MKGMNPRFVQMHCQLLGNNSTTSRAYHIVWSMTGWKKKTIMIRSMASVFYIFLRIPKPCIDLICQSFKYWAAVSCNDFSKISRMLQILMRSSIFMINTSLTKSWNCTCYECAYFESFTLVLPWFQMFDISAWIAYVVHHTSHIMHLIRMYYFWCILPTMLSCADIV